MVSNIVTASLILPLLFLFARYVTYRLNRRSLKDLRGPSSPSRLLGNEMQVSRQDQVGDLDLRWIGEYGPTWRTTGCLGKELLNTVDPKALQYIFQTSGYNFPKTVEMTQTIRILTDRGISWAYGEIHQRQRKVMNPAFGAPQLRLYLPIIHRYSCKLGQKWKDALQSNVPAGEQIFNVYDWLTRAALDITGETSFNYRFDAMEHSNGEFLNCFSNLFADSMLHPPAWDFLFRALWPYLPERVLYLFKYLPTREYRRFLHFVDTAKKVGREMIKENMALEKGGRDAISVLIRSNNAEDPKRRLDDDEILSQIAQLMIAGYESTGSSLSWLLYELARCPADQRRVREEILAARGQALARGDSEFTIADYDSMTFTNNAIKEALRLHPIVPTFVRVALRDDIIPLAIPLETKSGKVITEIPINKGQEINTSVYGYNRLKSVWGEDAEEWNPRRWDDTTKQAKQISVGTYANTMTFSAGVKSCIGWRLGVLQMQAILAELLQTFEFAPLPDIEIQSVPTKILIPMVRGRMHEGVQLPLRVSLVERK